MPPRRERGDPPPEQLPKPFSLLEPLEISPPMLDVTRKITESGSIATRSEQQSSDRDELGRKGR